MHGLPELIQCRASYADNGLVGFERAEGIGMARINEPGPGHGSWFLGAEGENMADEYPSRTRFPPLVKGTGTERRTESPGLAAAQPTAA
jgi:hypothetical protein